MKRPAVLAAATALAACTHNAPHAPAPGGAADVARADQQPTILQPARRPAPVTDRQADGSCSTREVTPAVYEQIMGEVQVVQADIAEDGTVIRPPVYRRAPVPRIVRPRAEIRFAAPCPETMTPDFVASLQRALAARGYLDGAVSGQIDAATSAAIRRYQSERGLESDQVSLETARALGLVAVPRDAQADG